MTAYFRCEPTGCGVSTTSCARRHLKVMTPAQGYGRSSLDVIHAGPCYGCPVGAAHALGGTPTEWPDGRHIVRAESPSGLGYNVHKPEPGRGARMHRGARATGPIKTALGGVASSAILTALCACGAKRKITRARCAQCKSKRDNQRSKELRAGAPKMARFHQSKLTDEAIASARFRCAAGESKRSVARELGVTPASLRNAMNGNRGRV